MTTFTVWLYYSQNSGQKWGLLPEEFGVKAKGVIDGDQLILGQQPFE